MSFMIEMVRDSAEAGGRDRFSTSAEAWALLLDLGKAFGWKPLGATYMRKQAAGSSDKTVLHNYQPGSHQDYKYVSAEDATAWAMALSEARLSPHLEAMLGARPGAIVLRKDSAAEEIQSANAPFSVVMNEFIQYAFGGAFSFARAE